MQRQLCAMTMRRPSTRLARLRFALGGALLSALAVLAASCVEAVGANGYTDTFAETCSLASRCYGPAFQGCDERVSLIEAFGRETDWLVRVNETGCLADCDVLYLCLDFEPICSGINSGIKDVDECALDEDCCGFPDGTTVCDDGLCCRALGAPCASHQDCCPNIGTCSGETGTCGGVTCAAAGEACLNSFQCCSGRCSEEGVCEELPCPPEGFECEIDADCCKLLCDPATSRCTDPACSLEGEPCLTADDCCNDTFVCNTNGGQGGVCSPELCNPDESDCHDDSQCCSGHCIDIYNLCGDCVGNGQACSNGVPCCSGSVCESGECVPCAEKGAACSADMPCCVELECSEAGACKPIGLP